MQMDSLVTWLQPWEYSLQAQRRFTSYLLCCNLFNFVFCKFPLVMQNVFSRKIVLMIYSNYNNIITIQYSIFDGFILEWIKKGWFYLYSKAQNLPVRSVDLTAIKITIVREMLRSRFRDDIGKVRAGCLAVDSSIWDLKPGRVEQSYTTVVETSVANYQSTRLTYRKTSVFTWIKLCFKNVDLASVCR